MWLARDTTTDPKAAPLSKIAATRSANSSYDPGGITAQLGTAIASCVMALDPPVSAQGA